MIVSDVLILQRGADATIPNLCGLMSMVSKGYVNLRITPKSPIGANWS
jgi:hypothetical protein